MHTHLIYKAVTELSPRGDRIIPWERSVRLGAGIGASAEQRSITDTG